MSSTGAAVFGAVDYSVFLIMLFISMLIGVHFGRQSNSAHKYLSGIRDIKILPIGLSIVASSMSPSVIMSFPNEVYSYGIMVVLLIPGMLLAVLSIGYIYLPVFYKTGVTNAFEYLERRFDWKVSKLMSFFFIVNTCAYTPFVLYLPSLAFSQVTGANVHVINAVIGSICVIYTMIGGIKAVVWTDVLQAIIMMIAVGAVTISGVIKVGGLDVVFKRSEEAGRLHLLDFDLDLTKRNSFWAMLFFSLSLSVGHIGFNQTCVQRLIAMKSEIHARRAVLYNFIGYAILNLLSFFSGLVIFANYYNCDPVKAKIISKGDKIVPYFVMNTIGHWTGMPGLFIAAMFSASLSTMSAQLNSLSGIIYNDYVRKFRLFEHTDFRARMFMKLIIFISGIYIILSGFIIDNFGHIVQFLTIAGSTVGLSTGVFTFGMLCPWANKNGAFYGTIISAIISVWMITGNLIALNSKSITYPPLPTSLEGCDLPNDNITMAINATINTASSVTTPDEPFILYRLSFYIFPMVNAALIWVFGLLISFMTGYTKPRELDKAVLASCMHWLLPKQTCSKVNTSEPDDEKQEKDKELQIPLNN